jgi:hypothetical protein
MVSVVNIFVSDAGHPRLVALITISINKVRVLTMIIVLALLLAGK